MYGRLFPDSVGAESTSMGFHSNEIVEKNGEEEKGVSSPSIFSPSLQSPYIFALTSFLP